MLTGWRRKPPSCSKWDMKHADRLPTLVLLCLLLVVYGLTLAPGLTWANRGADGGDLITAAAVGGVPHPTGYPVYILTARVFQMLPMGSLAFRTNLLSAIAAAFTSLLIYLIVVNSIPSRNRFAGFTAGAAFGLTPLFWSQAVITEVYTLHVFFLALLLYWSLFPPFPDKKKSDLALGIAFGVAMGNHLTSILTLPVILISASSIRDDRRQVDFHSLGRRSLGLGIGLLVYLVLPLRALSDPPLNWGNPITWQNFFWLVSGRLYQEEVFGLSLPSLWERMRSALGFLLAQYGIPGFSAGMLGVVFLRSARLRLATIWIALAYFTFAVIYATEDSFLHLIPAVMCMAIWIGHGMDEMMGWLSRRTPVPGWAVGILLLLWLFFAAYGTWSKVDASRDARAEQFGSLVMTQIPENALVFTRGDPVIFSLWYFHYALRQRTDIAVIVIDQLQFDWYRETLKSTYPSLSIPGPYPFPDAIIAANPSRPVCIVEYDTQANIRCP